MKSAPDKREIAKQMLSLHHRIHQEIEQQQIDPGKLMRLIGAGVAQLLVAQAAQLSEEALSEPKTG